MTWFDQRDGLGSKACSWIRTGIHRTRDGKVWVATAAGPSVIDPDDWRKRRDGSRSFPVHLEQVDIEGTDFFKGVPGAARDPGNLPASTGRITLKFASLNFGSTDFLGFRYRLRGLDSDWSALTKKNFAVYQNLPPGSYVFEVEGLNQIGRASPAARWEFSIAPEWWQRTDVRIAAGIAAATLLYGFYSWRIRAFRRRQAEQAAFSRQLIDSQESERKRIAGELHDGLGQHLLLIKNSTELARRKLDDESPLRERLAEVTEIAGDAIREVREITGNLRPTALDKLGLRVATRSMLERVNENSPVEVTHHLEGLDAGWNEREQITIFRLVQEALNNALKHAEAEHITITARHCEASLDLEIADDGKGFAISAPGSGGLGLTGMRERTTLLSGTFQVVSTPGAGTRILISIPLPSARS